MPRTEIKKKTATSINNMINSLVKKHGLEVVRKSVNKYFDDIRTKNKLENEIKDREAELEKLRRKAR